MCIIFYDVAMGCDGGVGWKAAAMSSFVDVGTVVGIKGAGLAPAVISVISGVAVAVTVTAELPAGVIEGCGGLIEATGIKGGVIPPITGVPWTWGENEGTVGGAPPGATKGVPTGYVSVVAGDVDGKLGLKGFMAGGAAVVLRFNVAIPDSRPGRRTLILLYIKKKIIRWDGRHLNGVRP